MATTVSKLRTCFFRPWLIPWELGRFLHGHEISLLSQRSVYSLRKDVFLMYFQCIISSLYDFNQGVFFDRQTRFTHVAG